MEINREFRQSIAEENYEIRRSVAGNNYEICQKTLQKNAIKYR